MSVEQLNKLGCKEQGNVVSMDTLMMFGVLLQHDYYFTCNGTYDKCITPSKLSGSKIKQPI